LILSPRAPYARAVRPGAFYLLFALGTLGAPGVARAGPRRIFEPTDLDLEAPGSLEVDLQIGILGDRDTLRVVVPDFEINLGVLSWLELDLDGTIAVEGSAPRVDHCAFDNLWLAAKIGLLSRRTRTGEWALGLQAGPRFPSSPGARGVGVEAVALLGHGWGRLHEVLNVGGFIDPAPGASLGYPRAVQLGLDLAVELRRGTSATGELGGVYYVSGEPYQLLGTLGITHEVGPRLEVTVVAVVGRIDGRLRAGALFGVAWRMRLWA
jgi:hypothetical protein